MIVAFCGHREVQDVDAVCTWLHDVIEQLILEGADMFYFGGKGNFDALAAGEVMKFKAAYPALRSTLVQAYMDQEKLPWLHDDSVYPPLETVPRRFAMHHRDRWMVQQADTVVTYAVYSWGNAMRVMEYAQRQGKRVLNYDAGA